MKKKLLLMLLCVALLAFLTSCACEHEWVEASCLTPRTCSLCEETEGESLGHTWAEADCVTPKTCSVCAETEGEALGHTWADADCVTPKTCSVCAETEGEPLGHAWVDADCITPKTCSVCAVTEGEPLGHAWVEADCVTPKTCSVCAVTEGEPLGHAWVEADCVTPKTCSVCAATEGEALGHTWVEADCVTPKTCSVCAATEGEALGHTWVEADCVTPKTCSVCAATEGEALGHTWVEATCDAPKTCSVCDLTEGEVLEHQYTAAPAANGLEETCGLCGHTVVTPFESASGIALTSGFSTTELIYAIPEGWSLQPTDIYLGNPAEKNTVYCRIAQHNGGTLSDLQTSYQNAEGFSQVKLETRADGVEYISMLFDNQPAVALMDDQYLYTLLVLIADDGEPIIQAAELADIPKVGDAIPDSEQLRLIENAGIILPVKWDILKYSLMYDDEVNDRLMRVDKASGYEQTFTTSDLYERFIASGIAGSVHELRTNSQGLEYVHIVLTDDAGENNLIIQQGIVHNGSAYIFSFANTVDSLTDDDILYTLAQDVANSFRIIE